jgi:hypothetical protein
LLLALGYEDLVDHDELCHDPDNGGAGWQSVGASKGLRAAGRQIDSQPARTRRRGAVGHRIGLGWFLDTHQRPPKQLVLDLDATDDPLHTAIKRAGSFTTITTATAPNVGQG